MKLMSDNLKYNFLLGLFIVAIPVMAHFFSGRTNPSTGIGFDVLLYKPFDFAYIIFTLILFAFINIKFRKNNIKVSVLKSIVWSFDFLIISFLLLSQLHLNMGGNL